MLELALLKDAPASTVTVPFTVKVVVATELPAEPLSSTIKLPLIKACCPAVVMKLRLSVLVPVPILKVAPVATSRLLVAVGPLIDSVLVAVACNETCVLLFTNSCRMVCVGTPVTVYVPPSVN